MYGQVVTAAIQRHTLVAAGEISTARFQLRRKKELREPPETRNLRGTPGASNFHGKVLAVSGLTLFLVGFRALHDGASAPDCDKGKALDPRNRYFARQNIYFSVTKIAPGRGMKPNGIKKNRAGKS